MTESRFSVVHVRTTSDRFFADDAAFERRLGRFEPDVSQALAQDGDPERPGPGSFTQTTIDTMSYMNRDSQTPVNRDAVLETFAAELALAAYRVALRTRTQGTWLDLELDLWRELADTAKTWDRESSRCR
jgi:hypothetical protein